MVHSKFVMRYILRYQMLMEINKSSLNAKQKCIGMHYYFIILHILMFSHDDIILHTKEMAGNCVL